MQQPRATHRHEAARIRRRSILCALLFVLFSAGASVAMPLAEYREQVRAAAATLDELPQWRKVESEADYTRRVTVVVEQLRARLLTVKTVEWNNTTIVVDHKWLAEALVRYEQIADTNLDARAAELAHLRERLQALDQRLTELDVATKGTDKNEEKSKLDSILRRPEYSEEANEEGAIERFWRRLREWLRDLFPRSSNLEPGTGGTLSGISQLIVIGLSLAVIVFVLWKFTPMFRRGGGGRKSREKTEARVVLGERLEADQTAADLLAEAEALARAGNLRAAIRKGYIALLCELGDRKIIGLAEHKTNRDYLGDVRQREPLHAQMQQLTRTFENHWYGLVPATEQDWNAFRTGFQRAVNSEQ